MYLKMIGATIASICAMVLLALGGTAAEAAMGGGGHGFGGMGGGGMGHFSASPGGGMGHFNGGGMGRFSGMPGGGHYGNVGPRNYSPRSFNTGRMDRSPRLDRGPMNRMYPGGKNYAYDRHNHGDHDHHHGHHRHGYPIFIGGYPYYGDYYYDDYYYDNGYSCGWLYRRAVVTGSPYWWRRYRDCVD